MNLRSPLIAFVFFFTSALELAAQTDTIRALFIGNSYTGVNNLPQLVANLSASGGKTLIIDSNTPGGYSYGMHATDATSLSKIAQGGWDVVVLQEQSQIPTIDQYRYTYMYPGAAELRDSIRLYNPCATIITYMTWGRRFGGQQCINGYCSPVFTDFNHMQDSLRSAYEEVSDLIGAKVAPVGMAWKKALQEDTTLVLHASDNSHPDITGSYLAACVFHCAIWQESPVGFPYLAGLSPALALRFQEIADSVYFYSSSDWNRTIDLPVAAFTYSIANDTVCFTNTSYGPSGTEFTWDFGDGTGDTAENTCHAFTSTGNYAVRLIANHCGILDTETVSIPWQTNGLSAVEGKNHVRCYPNPVSDRMMIETSKDLLGSPFELSDLTGKIVLEGIIRSQPQELNLRELKSGSYFLRIRDRALRIIKR